MKNRNLILYFLLVASSVAQAQVAATNTGGQVKQTQPRVMVVPRVKEGEDIRNLLDQNEALRSGVTKMKEWFDTKEFPTIDFVAALKAALADQTFTSDQQTDMKTMIIQMANPDIYVELDVSEISCSGAHIARVNMNAYYTATGYSIGSVVAESPCNVAELGRLVNIAIDKSAEKFLASMQVNFNDIRENGVPIKVDIGFAASSDKSMSDEVKDGKELSEIIEDWIANAAYKNQYDDPSVVDKKMIFPSVRLPLVNQETKKKYTSTLFANEITKYLKSIGFTAKKDNKTGGIFITIQ
jgi:hypothetical protein